MSLHYDPIQNAIEIQLGGVFSQRPSNPELLITSAIDQKHHSRKPLTEEIISFALQGYTQAEMGAFFGMSQRHVGRLMSKIPVSDPYIVGGGKEMQVIQKIEAELKTHQILEGKKRHSKANPHPDPTGWMQISEGGYRRRRLSTSEEQFERED